MSPTIQVETWNRFDPARTAHASAIPSRSAGRRGPSAASRPLSPRRSRTRGDRLGRLGWNRLRWLLGSIARPWRQRSRGEPDPDSGEQEARNGDLVEQEGVVERRGQTQRSERREEAGLEPPTSPKQHEPGDAGEREPDDTVHHAALGEEPKPLVVRSVERGIPERNRELPIRPVALARQGLVEEHPTGSRPCREALLIARDQDLAGRRLRS